jgi:hypothetical protein
MTDSAAGSILTLNADVKQSPQPIGGIPDGIPHEQLDQQQALMMQQMQMLALQMQQIQMRRASIQSNQPTQLEQGATARSFGDENLSPAAANAAMFSKTNSFSMPPALNMMNTLDRQVSSQQPQQQQPASATNGRRDSISTPSDHNHDSVMMLLHTSTLKSLRPAFDACGYTDLGYIIQQSEEEWEYMLNVVKEAADDMGIEFHEAQAMQIIAKLRAEKKKEEGKRLTEKFAGKSGNRLNQRHQAANDSKRDPSVEVIIFMDGCEFLGWHWLCYFLTCLVVLSISLILYFVYANVRDSTVTASSGAWTFLQVVFIVGFIVSSLSFCFSVYRFFRSPEDRSCETFCEGTLLHGCTDECGRHFDFCACPCVAVCIENLRNTEYCVCCDFSETGCPYQTCSSCGHGIQSFGGLLCQKCIDSCSSLQDFITLCGLKECASCCDCSICEQCQCPERGELCPCNCDCLPDVNFCEGCYKVCCCQCKIQIS